MTDTRKIMALAIAAGAFYGGGFTASPRWEVANDPNPRKATKDRSQIKKARTRSKT